MGIQLELQTRITKMLKTTKMADMRDGWLEK